MLVNRNYRDILGGLLLFAFGMWVAVYAGDRYDLGSVPRMGPGMFPTALGYLLAGLGVLIAIPAFFRTGTRMSFALRPFIFIMGGILVFSVAITYLGMVPAILLLVVASALADDKLGVWGVAILAASVTLIGVLVFTYGLGMHVQLFKWGAY